MNLPDKIKSIVRNIFFVLIILYYSQGALFSEGTIFTQSVLFAILGISGYYFVRVMFLPMRPALVNVWTAFLLLNILNFLFTLIFLTHKVEIDNLKVLLMVLLPFYPFYYLGIRNQLKVKHFIYFFIVSLLISIVNFNNEQAFLLYESTREDVVNNTAYAFVGLIPFVFLIRNHLFAYISLIIISYFIIQGAKRGALVVGGVGLLMYAYYQIRTVPKTKRFQAYTLVIMGLIAISYFINFYYSQNEFLQQRINDMAEGSSSGRDIIYISIFNNWLNSDNIFNLIFGYGFLGSMKLSSTGHVAHNDWLELLANTGLIGVVIYALLFYILIKTSLNPVWSKNKRLLLLTCTLIWFVTTLFSMGFNSASFTGMFMLIAYIIGSKNKKLI